MAQLVSEQLNFIGSFSNSIEENSESSWGGHSLLSSNRTEVKLVGVFISHTRIYDSSCSGVCESASRSCENSGIHTLARVDEHELARVS